MDYACRNGTDSVFGAKLGDSANPGLPLQRISFAVNRVNTAVVRVGNFVERFHGACPQEAPQALAGAIEASPPYGIGMEQLFAALDRLETRIEALEAIG